MGDDRVFVDTWGWLVLANGRDPAFREVARLRAAVAGRRGAWVTTDYILDETVTRLFASARFTFASRFMEGVFDASRQDLIDIERVTPDRFNQAWQLRLRYSDKPRISFTDLTSFVVMRELKLKQVLTNDSHFQPGWPGFRVASLMCLISL